VEKEAGWEEARAEEKEVVATVVEMEAEAKEAEMAGAVMVGAERVRRRASTRGSQQD
jgi:hypothetical protein